METLSSKAAYLKGLADGMELDESSKKVKLMKAIIDVVNDIAASVDEQIELTADLSEEVEDIQEHVDAVDEDLAEVEDAVDDLYYGDDYEDDYFDDDDELDIDDDDEYEICCPECEKTFTFKGEDLALDEPIECPYCGCNIDEIEIIDDDEADDIED